MTTATREAMPAGLVASALGLRLLMSPDSGGKIDKGTLYRWERENGWRGKCKHQGHGDPEKALHCFQRGWS